MNRSNSLDALTRQYNSLKRQSRRVKVLALSLLVLDAAGLALLALLRDQLPFLFGP